MSERAPVAHAEGDDSTTRWRSDGYGLFIERRGDTLHHYEVTAISCVRSLTSIRQSSRGDTIRFVAPSTNGDLGGVEDAFDLQPGPSPDRQWMSVDGAISRIGLIRDTQRPARCDSTAAADPRATYAVFWHTWHEHYPFFTLKRIDWNAVDRAHRSRIDSTTTPRALFEHFREMIAPFTDAHTFIHATTLDIGYGGGRPLPSGYARNADSLIRHVIATRYLTQGLRPMLNGQMEIGRLAADIPYVRLTSFAEYARDPRFAVQLDSLETALDTLLVDADRWRGLVIDVRQNGGGSDVFGTVIAGRLADRDYVAYDKVIRNDTTVESARTAPQRAMVVRSPRRRFTGPVVLLTGIESVSAAETFAMALMGRQPAVTRIGEHTQGVFSDVLTRRLPNGWMFGLPNEIYLTTTGVAYDGPGVPPDITVPVFRTSDVRAGRDPAIERALRMLAASAADSLSGAARRP
ncbi:MAG: S41 family peptidase [Gemmatimonadaceae bacterium]|nr:S41 family peptidase [Gemmatimonadaceae bacterium]